MYRIVADSSCDMNEELNAAIPVERVPFYLNIGDETVVDDGSVEVSDLLAKMQASPDCAKTACPAPGAFAAACGDEDCFIITISSQLSGTFSSAEIGRDMLQDENEEQQIHVFNSKSASAGETLIAIKLRELMDKGLPFREIAERIEEFIAKMKTMFVLENLDNLVKNGRLGKLAGFVSSRLHLCPIMRGDDGEIALDERSWAIKRLCAVWLSRLRSRAVRRSTTPW